MKFEGNEFDTALLVGPVDDVMKHGTAICAHLGAHSIDFNGQPAGETVAGRIYVTNGPAHADASGLLLTGVTVLPWPYLKRQMGLLANVGFPPYPRPGGAIKPTPDPASRIGTASQRQEGGTHYKDMNVQPWDVVDTWPLEQRIGYYRGGALKYLMRMGSKDENPGEIAKGQHYMEKLLEVLKCGK